MHTFDCPVIIVSGTAEMTEHFPLNTDSPGRDQMEPRLLEVMPTTKQQRISSWQRRLYGSRCPSVTAEEMEAVKENGTRAEKALGFPCAHSETLRVDGQEIYIGDLRNIDGNIHLRVVAIENLAHTTCEFMHTISWSFLRRFARDTENDLVIELYQ